MPIHDLFPKDASLQLMATLRVYCEGEKFFGPGKLTLLELIHETGSISQAAKKMGLSYKKAWGMVEALNTQAIRPIVIKQPGGSKGGKTLITEDGLALMEAFRRLDNNFKDFLAAQLPQFLGT